MPSRTVRAPRGPLQFGDRATRDQPAVIDDHERLAKRLGDLHLVRREDDRPALIAQLDERVAQQRKVDRIEPGERLIHEEDVRRVQDRGDELDLLLIALAELFGTPVRQIRDPEPLEPGEGVRAGLPGPLAVERGEVDELIDDGEARVEAALFREITERAPREVGRRDAIPADLAFVRAQDPEADPHGRRLARAVRAKEAEDPALGHAEGEPIERHGPPEPLRDAVDLEGHRARG